MPPKTPAKPSTTEVYARLRSLIIGGEIPPDTKINIVALARDLGVSQTPVREALQRLEGDNLITYQPGRGYSTTPLLDLPGLRALFEFRLLVEPWAARAAAVDRLSNPGAALGRQLDDFEGILARREKGGPDAKDARDARDVRQELVAHDAAFHAAVITASDNSVVEQAYEQTHCHLHTFRLYPEEIDTANTVVEHRRISAAISGCEPDAAEEAMGDHIRSSFERFARAFGDPRAAAPPAPPKVPPRRLLT